MTKQRSLTKQMQATKQKVSPPQQTRRKLLQSQHSQVHSSLHPSFFHSPFLRSRNGILITIAALLLFLPLVELALFSAQVSEKRLDLVELSLVGEKLASLEDDLASSYRTILGLDFVTQRVGNVQRLTIRELPLTMGNNRTALVQDYADFMETTFANLSTINLSLSLNNTMTVAALNVSFELNDTLQSSMLRVPFTQNGDEEEDRALQKLSLEMTLSVLNSSLISQSLPSEDDDDDSLPVTLFIKDSTGTKIVKKTFNLELDSNARFAFTFNTTPISRFNITITEDAEELRIEASQLNATIHRLDLDFKPVNETIRVEGSDLVISVPGYAYRKEAPLLIYRG